MSEDQEKFEARSPETDVVVHNEQNSFLATIERLASRPDIDVSKIEKIMDMQERVLDRNAKQAFNAAMVRAQANMPIVPRDATNEQTRSLYARYETVVKHASPVYTGAGFSISTYEGDTVKEDHIRICADVMHEEGHTKQYWTDLPLDKAGIKGTVNKTSIHATKSTLTYGKGILLCSIFNISAGYDVDDDGNAGGSEFITEEQRIELEKIMVEKGVDAEAFFKYMKVETTDTILASDFNKAMNALKKAKGHKAEA